MQSPHTEIILRHDETELALISLPPGEYVIGRSSEAEIFANTPLLSRKHARLTIHPDHLVIEDLGSSNGTFVNDQRVHEPTRVFPSQQIRLGDVHLDFRRQRTLATLDTALGTMPESIRHLVPEELLAQRRYAVGAIVAQGGMGAILSARQSAMKRGVAMKVMLANRDEGDVLRFIEEAQITGQLEHPNIVPVHELGVDDNDQLYYTMKMVRGETLRKVLELLEQSDAATATKYPLATLLTIFQKTADGVAFAHSKGVIHRDLKPENVMIGDFGEVLVMDWGLAKIIGQSDAPSVEFSRSIVAGARSGEGALGSTLAGTIMGTPQYMSPEQARGEVETLDVRSDVYALGTILFHLLWMRPPIDSSSSNQMVMQAALGEIHWPDAKELKRKLPHLPGGRAPDSLLAVCRKALALEVGERYQRVEDLQLDVIAYQNGFATGAEQAGAWKQFQLLVRRHRAASVAVAAALVVVAVVTGVFTLNVVRERNRAEASLRELRGTAPTFAAQAKALVEAGQLEEALDKIGYAVKLDPENPDHHLQRAHVLQINLRLREAAAEYDRVLALRPNDPSAQENAALIQQLLAANGGREDLPAPLLIKLVDGLLAQGRIIEANPLALRVGKGSATSEATLRVRLKHLTAQPGWRAYTRLRTFPNSTIGLNLNGLRVADAEALRGFPISDLTINDPKFTDLAPLAGMPLTTVGLSPTNVSDLSPLSGLPIETLWLSGTKVSDLTPLRTMKLKTLSVGDLNLPDLRPLAGLALERLDIYTGSKAASRLTDLSPLRGMPLKELNANGNAIVDFSPLEGMPLERLEISGNQLTKLPKLQGLPLRNLQMSGNRISDLTPLAGLPLRNLNASSNQISDLNVLRKMPLQSLDLNNNFPLDLAPLADCRELEEIVLPREFLHEEVLRTLPKLKRARIPAYQPSLLPIAQFWAELKPEWLHLAHARTLIQLSGLKTTTQNPAQLDPDGTLFLDLGNCTGRELPSFQGLPIGRLNMTNATVTSLAPLGGLRIRRLALQGTPITDLSPLHGMPLESISCNGTPVSDLTPLRGMPLKQLQLGGTKVKDLSPLAELPLEDLNLGGLRLADIAILRGRPLRRLDFGGNNVRDLSPLAGMRLEFLNASGNQIADLSPLRGMPLQNLNLGSNKISDLSPLRGLVLTELYINSNPISDLTPLRDLPKLEKLRVSASPEQLLFLRDHPALAWIATSSNGAFVPVREFWETYDARQRAGTK